MTTAAKRADSAVVTLMLSMLLTYNHMSIVELARRLHLDDSVVGLWVNGRRRVPPRRLPDLASVFGMTTDDLLEGRVSNELEQRVEREREAARARFADVAVVVEDGPQQRLAGAGMTADRHQQRWELYCFLCGRGVGPGGVLRITRHMPHWAPPCVYCGGHMFLREVAVWRLARIVFGPGATTGSMSYHLQGAA